jgi:hypothetical protein
MGEITMSEPMSNMVRLTEMLLYAPLVDMEGAWFRKISKCLTGFSKETLLYTDTATTEEEVLKKLTDYTKLKVMHILNPNKVDEEALKKTARAMVTVVEKRRPRIIIGLAPDIYFLAPIFESVGLLVTESGLEDEAFH